jgi:hypothetical protein
VLACANTDGREKLLYFLLARCLNNVKSLPCTYTHITAVHG